MQSLWIELTLNTLEKLPIFYHQPHPSTQIPTHPPLLFFFLLVVWVRTHFLKALVMLGSLELPAATSICCKILKFGERYRILTRVMSIVLKALGQCCQEHTVGNLEFSSSWFQLLLSSNWDYRLDRFLISSYLGSYCWEKWKVCCLLEKKVIFPYRKWSLLLCLHSMQQMNSPSRKTWPRWWARVCYFCY